MTFARTKDFVDEQTGYLAFTPEEHEIAKDRFPISIHPQDSSSAVRIWCWQGGLLDKSEVYVLSSLAISLRPSMILPRVRV